MHDNSFGQDASGRHNGETTSSPSRHLEARDEKRPEKRDDKRSGSRDDKHYEKKDEKRPDSRDEKRNEKRPAGRYEKRDDKRDDKHAERRPERRPDSRDEKRSDNRYEKRDEKDYGKRPDNRFDKRDGNRDDKREGGGAGRRGFDPVGALRELDRDLIRLVVRRSRLVAGLSKTGEAVRERELRSAWEENAAKESRDPRFIRQLFALLQEVEVQPALIEKSSAFNLAPARQPVDVTLDAPASSRLTQLFLALAAATGSGCSLCGIPLNGPVVECLKAFNQVGAQLRWEEPDRIDCTEAVSVAGPTGSILDKVVHLGADPLTLYLVLFQMVTRPTRLKLIGEGDLKFLNLAALRRLLPSLGARLTQVVPGQEGVPVRLESSAILPDAVRLEADVPADAVTALLLSAPFWGRPVTFDLEAHPEAEAVLTEAVSVLRLCGAQVTADGTTLAFSPGELRLPAEPVVDMDVPAAAFLLALPAFAGGSMVLRGRWPANGEAKAALALLNNVAVIDADGQGIRCSRAARTDASTGQIVDLTAVPDVLLPLGVALFLLGPLGGGGGELPLLPKDLDGGMLDGFLARVGLTRDGSHLTPAGPNAPEAAQTPWAAPSASWALALALLAFVRPNLKLSNPGIVTAQLPHFWKMYNALPNPAEDLQAPASVDAPAKPGRRRVLAGYMPASQMPTPLVDEEE